MKHLNGIAKVVSVALLLFSCSALTAFALSIDGSDKFAWGENVGWLNWGTPEGNVDVPVNTGDLTGYVWGENVGWISLNCSNTSSCGSVDYGVIRSGPELLGYGWGENVGWVSFSCENTASCGAVNYRVFVNEDTGVFSGWAWGENIGWISTNCSNTGSCATVDYKVRTEEPPNPGGGGGSVPTPTPAQTPTPTGTPVPTVTPAFSPTPVATFSPVPQPTGTVSPAPLPSPFPTPPAPPPPIMPPTPPPSPAPTGPGPFSRFIQWMGNLLDTLMEAIFGFLGESCNGVLGVASCGVTALAVGALALGLLAALLQHELAAAAFSLFQFLGLKKKARVWGVVYDSATKRPIPAAKMELMDASGRILEVRYADREGRYGFLTTPASLNQPELKASIRVTKSGYRFPTAMALGGTDYFVYENTYRGGLFDIIGGSGLVNYSIPMDPIEPGHGRASGFGAGLFVGVSSRLLSLAFIVGLVAVPLNYYFAPTTSNLVILIVFFAVNALRMFVAYRPYGVTVDALTGAKLPYALVTLLDEQGNRVGFAVSDEHGRYVLSGQRNRQYDVVAYTPANIIPQRSSRERVSKLSHVGRTAWVTRTLRI